jgi:hypothetical protein
VGLLPGNDNGHALLWNGTAASVVDLHPAGFNFSGANGVWGGSQVGAGRGPATGFSTHALLWNGTAASVVDLHPAGFLGSVASDVWGTEQVGWGYDQGAYNHALLWHGTAASVVDLHPAGYGRSWAYAVSNGIQVGYADSGAIAWSGTAERAVNLHQFLPGLGQNFTSSIAYAIDSNGTIAGSAGTAGRLYAVIWTPIPEPSAAVLFCCGLAAATILHRRRSAVD